jgi:hypothetical protein
MEKELLTDVFTTKDVTSREESVNLLKKMDAIIIVVVLH